MSDNGINNRVDMKELATDVIKRMMERYAAEPKELKCFDFWEDVRRRNNIPKPPKGFYDNE